MRDVYHETFFKLPSASNRKERPDGRTSRYSTVFSPSREPQLQNPKEVIDFQTLDFHALRSRPDLIQRLYLNDSISNVTPEKINDMLSFRKLCSELLLEIGDYSKLGKLLAKELEQTTYIFSVFHAHTLSIISIEWFRSRRESQKRALINDGFPFKYTSDEAAKAAVLLADLTFGNLDWVVSLMQIAEQAFLQYQMFAHCRLIDQRLLVMKQGDALWTGILHENIAVSYRNESKPKLMVSEMKRAIDSYRKSGDTYRVCVG